MLFRHVHDDSVQVTPSPDSAVTLTHTQPADNPPDGLAVPTQRQVQLLFAKERNTMKFVVAVVVALLLVPAAAAKPAKPKPWMWTTTAAAREVVGLDIWPAEGTLTGVRCQGKGKSVAKRYGAFRCSASFEPRRLADPTERVAFWVKVRRRGTGQPCASPDGLAAIPKACLNPTGVRADGSRDDASAQTQVAVGGPGGLYQGQVGCLGFGAGFWRCWFGTEQDGPQAGHAVVVFFKAGPKVTILNQFST